MSNWKNAATLLHLDSLKLFLLVSLKTFKQSLSILFGKFWILLLLLIAFSAIEGIEMATYVFGLLLFFIMLLVVRPSIERKDCSYFLSYFRKIIGFLGVSFGVISIYWLARALIELAIFGRVGSHIVSPFQHYIVIGPWFVLTSLAYLDTSGGIKDVYFSIVRGLKMMACYFPAVLVLGLFNLLFFYVGLGGFYFLKTFLNGKALNLFVLSVGFCFLSILTLFFFCVTTTLYIKAKHTNYRLIFK